MHPTNQLLDRSRQIIAANSWYLGIPRGAGPLPGLPCQYASSDSAAVVHELPEHTVHPGHSCPGQPMDQIILYYPKSKSEADYLCRLALSKLSTGGRLWLVGENKGGIKTVPKYFAGLELVARKLDSAKHCSLFEVIPDKSQTFELADLQISRVETAEGLTICSLPGVFGYGKLDHGTQLLLDHLPKLNGKILDFGCGSGLITASLLAANASLNMHASDISFRALQATELTLKSNNLPTATLWHSDGFNQLEQRFNHIVSNPPFHEGIKTEYSMTEAFITAARSRLAKGGSLTIVANTFLKYEPIFERAFGHCNILAQAKGFKVLQAHNR